MLLIHVCVLDVMNALFSILQSSLRDWRQILLLVSRVKVTVIIIAVQKLMMG